MTKHEEEHLAMGFARLTGRLDEGLGNIDRRLTSLEAAPPYGCIHEDEIEDARSIKAMMSEIRGLTTWRKWIMGSVLVVTLAAVGFGIASREVQARTAQRVSSVEMDVEEVKDDIDDLDGQLHQTREEILRAVKAEGRATRDRVQVERSDDHVSIREVEAKLSPRERRDLHRIIRASKNR